MPTEVHNIRIPRKVVGTVPRGRTPDAFLVADTVPVAIRVYGAGETSATFRDKASRVHRAIDGRPFMPIGEGGFEAAWEALFERLRPELLHDLGMGPYRGLEDAKGIHGWHRHLQDVTRRHGLSTEAPRLREIVDDGRAAQAEAARFMSERLALVDGILMLRTGLPRVHVSLFSMNYNIDELAEPLRWNDDPDIGKPLAAGDFRIGEFDHALALMNGVGRAMGLEANRNQPGFEVIDGGALTACYERIGSDRLLDLLGVGNEALEAMSFKLAKYPSEEIARFIELRRLLEQRDEDGLSGWMEGIEATAGIGGGIPQWGDEGYLKGKADLSFALARARYRDFIVPAHNLRSGDAAALAVM